MTGSKQVAAPPQTARPSARTHLRHGVRCVSSIVSSLFSSSCNISSFLSHLKDEMWGKKKTLTHFYLSAGVLHFSPNPQPQTAVPAPTQPTLGLAPGLHHRLRCQLGHPRTGAGGGSGVCSFSCLPGTSLAGCGGPACPAEHSLPFSCYVTLFSVTSFPAAAWPPRALLDCSEQTGPNLPILQRALL